MDKYKAFEQSVETINAQIKEIMSDANHETKADIISYYEKTLEQLICQNAKSGSIGGWFGMYSKGIDLAIHHLHKIRTSRAKEAKFDRDI